MRLGSDIVEVLEFPRQPRGNRLDTTAEPLRAESISGCSVQPGVSLRNRIDRDGVTVRATLYAPLTATITAHSIIKWQGRYYQVDAEPQQWHQWKFQTALLIDWQG